jgi:hypothetical protein
VIFGQHAHPTLIVLIFSGVVLSTKFTQIITKQQKWKKISVNKPQIFLLITSKSKSEPLLLLCRMSICRQTEFLSPLVICEYNYFISNISQNIYCFPGKTHVHLTICSALVAVKWSIETITPLAHVCMRIVRTSLYNHGKLIQ